MKKYLYLCSIVALLGACKEEYPEKWSGEDRVNFVQIGNSVAAIASDTITNYTFVFEKPEVKNHKIMVEVVTMGDVRNYPRAVTIKQVPSKGKNAVAGTHYIALDAPESQKQFVIPAGAAKAQLPITLLRDNLGEDEFELRIVFADNQYFLGGLSGFSHRTIRFSNKLSEPSKWNLIQDYFGSYSSEKHQFMYDATGKTIDNDYIQALDDTDDSSYLYYLQEWFGEKLKAANDLLESQGKPKHQFTFYN